MDGHDLPIASADPVPYPHRQHQQLCGAKTEAVHQFGRGVERVAEADDAGFAGGHANQVYSCFFLLKNLNFINFNKTIYRFLPKTLTFVSCQIYNFNWET